jgi:hypothetical protein
VTTAYLMGVKGWDLAVYQEPGQRWVQFTLDYMNDEMPRVAHAFSPEDAHLLGEALISYAAQATARDIGDRN